MKCEEAAKVFPLFLYGELSFDAEDELETHLGTCAGCRRERDRLKALLDGLDAAELDPSAELL